MAANYSELIIDNRPNQGYNIIPKEKTYEMPPNVIDIGVYINHTILIGEILGLNTEELLWAVNMLHRVGAQLEEDLPERSSTGTPVIKEIAELLLKEFENVFKTLDNAIDEEGRPLKITGESLISSSSLGTDDQGRLFINSHHIYLFDLQEKLKMLIDLINYAIKNNLLLRYV
jgi:hypothetical protein